MEELTDDGSQQRDWSTAVWFGWLALFAVLEILALRGKVPWTSLSEYVWNLEDREPVTKWTFIIGLMALAAHLVSGRPRKT